MKNGSFALDAQMLDSLFRPIRDKTDVIRLLMNAIKIILVNRKLSVDKVHGELILRVGKMNRLFFISDKKYFSVNFPFSVRLVGDDHVFSSKLVDDIDHKVTSEVLSLLNQSGGFSSHDVYEFIDPIVEVEDYSVGFWSLVRELMLFEDGYLRYDHDPVREDAARHPLNHLDIFYSNSATFKVGLVDLIHSDDLIDLVDTESDCHFLDTRNSRAA